MTSASENSVPAADVISSAMQVVDLEIQKQPTVAVPEKLDIEHAIVEDDPRDWSSGRKTVILVIVSAASVVAGLLSNLQNPANQEIEDDLHTSAAEISWSLSAYILIQCNFTFVWSAISEIKGRRLVYLVSFGLTVAGSVIVAASKSIVLFVGMRALQAVGSSAVMTLGAGTLADIYDPAERGSKVGVYYLGPLFGIALGATLGGALTQGFGWRAIYWFLTIFSGLNFLSFLLLFKDTFRRERSSAYQAVLRRHTRKQNQKRYQPHVEDASAKDPTTNHSDNNTLAADSSPLKEIKVSFTDVNPFPPLLLILRRWNNLALLFASGLLFAFSFSITYTCARTLSTKYHYNAFATGLVLLSFGIGNFLGSILGGRWSDRTLARLKANNGGKSHPEMRLESTKIAMWFLPPAVVGYAWVCEKHVHVSAICVMLFLAGFFSIWIYSSTLAYIMDANPGRSSTVVAANSSFRGTSAFVAAEIAVPLQDAIGDGGMYTIWAALMVVSEMLVLLVLYKGGKWREKEEARLMRNAGK